MKRSTDRILTTHVGSLVRPDNILEIMRDREPATSFSEAEGATIAGVVKDAVRRQVEECGIDIPTDGEFSKSSFSGYVSDRLTGWEMKPGPGRMARGRDRARFSEAYAEIDRPLPGGNTGGGRSAAAGHLVCTGPITYRSDEFVKADIANLKAALEGLDYGEAFMPAVGPGTVELQRDNEYYKTAEEYVFAIAEALKTEYKAIVDAGFILQIDDPRIVTEYDSLDPAPTAEEYRKFAAVRIEALNHALKGLPEDRIRYHLCWGSWHGPHTTDAPLAEIAETHPPGQRRRLLASRREPAPRARVPRLGAASSSPTARSSSPASSPTRPTASSTRS